MCGIAGVYNYADRKRRVSADLLDRMTDRLAHRGPDHRGVHIDGPLGLGYRRLAIVDTTQTGNQPMVTRDGRVWIVYNGEFYNHRDFRLRIEAAGVRFEGTSDTETLLNLFALDGPACLPELAAIFSVAFWEPEAARLTLARDPLGVKQLYYWDDGSRIMFASEIKAILECPDAPRRLNPAAVNEYLHFHTPLFETTFFDGISQLLPGQFLSVTPAGHDARVYWKIDDFTPAAGSIDDQVHELRDRLASTVANQLMSDAPVGSFFSGGIDSSAVAAFSARSGERPRCFGVHFSGQGVIDERPYQEAAAAALGLDLQLVTLDGEGFNEDLFRLLYFQDQPVIGAAMFPMYAVSRLAADNVKVCLGGQAADEVFGGYARYALAQPGQLIKSSLGSGSAGGFSSPGARVGGNLWKQLADRDNLRRIRSNVRNLASWRRRYFETFAEVSQDQWRTVIAMPDLVDRRACREVFYDTVARSAAPDPATKAMHWDAQTYLPGLFQQDDRMSMAVSLESRVPLADPRLVRFAFRLGFDTKVRAGSSKWILRQAVADVLPAEVLNRRKVGFDTPIERWMNDVHADFVRDTLLSKASLERGLWSRTGIEDLLSHRERRHRTDILWKVLCIEAWAQVFLDGGLPETAPGT